MEHPPPEADAILFRPSKKRKIYRQRAQEDEEATVAPALSIQNAQSLDELIAGASKDDEVEGVPVSMAEILRLRKLGRKRAGGVEFRADRHGNAAREEEQGLVLRQEQESDMAGPLEGGRKFAPQIGTVGDVNKHMMEYIDSELAKRRRAEEGVQASSTTTHAFGTAIGNGNRLLKGEVKVSTTEVHRQPAALGKLVEVDLGEEARRINEERTQRKLRGEKISDDDGMGPKKPVKVRLGRDGKPWRGRKKRNSEDIRRDALVDDILKESRLELYEEPAQHSSDVNDDQAADDRIAEAFRQEFMDAVSQRRQKKTAPPVTTSRNAPGKEEAVLKGPKLGGSRNARAAMRDLLLKEKTTKK